MGLQRLSAGAILAALLCLASSTGVGDAAAPPPPPAARVLAGDPAGGGLDAERQVAVLGRISYPWERELAGWTIEFLPGRPGFLGATWPDRKRIEIFVRADLDDIEVAFTLAHEIGHAVDVTHFDEDDRLRWLKARGRTGTPWWTGSGSSDFEVGAGDWAEAFAVWQVGGRSLSTLSDQPDAEDLALVAELARGDR